jgi:hypothetical protein
MIVEMAANHFAILGTKASTVSGARPTICRAISFPWGRLFAINVNTSDIAWQVPLGIIDSLPAERQNTGRPNLGGSVATPVGSCSSAPPTTVASARWIPRPAKNCG